jgi:hypothetical protein
MVKDFSAWQRTISSLTSDDSRDENQLAKIVATEATGLTLLAELIAFLKNAIIRVARPLRKTSRADLRGADRLAWDERRSAPLNPVRSKNGVIWLAAA